MTGTPPLINKKSETLASFARDVVNGLSETPKHLSSMYLYDDQGSLLYNEITQQPEYYLTRAEMEIIREQGKDFFNILNDTPFNLFELGCGNSKKTLRLLSSLTQKGQKISFYPMDISRLALQNLTVQIRQEYPELPLYPQEGDYLKSLKNLHQVGGQKKNVILFLGSNIGNFGKKETKSLLNDLYNGLQKGDLLLIGMDLKKDISMLTAAYNDAKGVTCDFNLNLLTRMNRELGANFDPDSFLHHEIYNPIEGAMQSFLISQKTQEVHFSQLDFSMQLDAFEPLFMESSYKYSYRDIQNLAEEAGFDVVEQFTDKNEYFVDSLWQRR